MKQRRVVIIFIRKPVAGKVKTRLAAHIGAEKALEIYKQLVLHTCTITTGLEEDLVLFYDELPLQDPWPSGTRRELQEGKSLGEKMANAFKKLFNEGYTRILIIGTDCPGLDEELIMRAWLNLEKFDVVIGPAADGGYYLLGMKEPNDALFRDIPWSTPEVLSETQERCTVERLSYFLLPVLHDVDVAADLHHLEKISSRPG